MKPVWVPLNEAIKIFSKYQDYASNEEKRGIYLREYNALKAFIEFMASM